MGRDSMEVLHEGGCHCGGVAFEVLGSPTVVAYNCNCSICDMKGFLHYHVTKDRFKLLKGEELLSVYQFGTKTAKHLFCKQCGICSFYIPRSMPDGYSVNVKCLKKETIGHLHVKDFDGQNWDKNAKDVNEMRDNAVNEIKKETESANVDAPKYKFGWRFLRQTDRADACGELSRGVYDGRDYLPMVFNNWCEENSPHRVVGLFLLHDDGRRELVGLDAITVLDSGKTVMLRALRISTKYRGGGLSKVLNAAVYRILHNHEAFKEAEIIRMSTFIDNKVAVGLYTKLGYTIVCSMGVAAFDPTDFVMPTDEFLESYQQNCPQLHQVGYDWIERNIHLVKGFFPSDLVASDWLYLCGSDTSNWKFLFENGCELMVDSVSATDCTLLSLRSPCVKRKGEEVYVQLYPSPGVPRHEQEQVMKCAVKREIVDAVRKQITHLVILAPKPLQESLHDEVYNCFLPNLQLELRVGERSDLGFLGPVKDNIVYEKCLRDIPLTDDIECPFLQS